MSGIYPDHPRLGVGAVVFKNEKVLLVKRGNPPAAGDWSIPGGRVELGETLKQAAEREIREETGIIIQAGEPVFTFEHIDRDEAGKIRFHYIIVDLAARYTSGDPVSGDDATDARWFSGADLEQVTVNPVTRTLLKEHFNFGEKHHGTGPDQME